MAYRLSIARSVAPVIRPVNPGIRSIIQTKITNGLTALNAAR